MSELDDLLERFDSDWRQDARRPSIDDFLDSCQLPPETMRHALCELIAIDMEYRWRQSVAQVFDVDLDFHDDRDGDPDRLGDQPKIEDYVRQWPEIMNLPPDPLADMIAEEYRIRHRFGDRPSVDEYRQRFGDLESLPHAIAIVADELKRDGEGVPPNLPNNPVKSDTNRAGCRPKGPQINQRWGSRYHIIKQLGRGGMGQVYLAEDRQMNRAVALKTPAVGPDDASRKRFLNEVAAAASLRHPGICPVFDTGEVEGQPFLTMAWIDGPTLEELLAQPGGVPITDLMQIFARIANAMQTAHEHGVVHRDLKPSNVMLDAELAPMITDFGLARIQHVPRGERLTQTGELLGSPAYMSPEQIEGSENHCTPVSDIYSLGVMLFEATTGRLPFTGTVGSVLVKIARDQPPSPRQLCREIDRELETLCLQMLAKDPGERPQTMSEVGQRLIEIQKRIEVAGTTPQPSRSNDDRTPKTVSRRSSVAAVTLIGVVATGLILRWSGREEATQSDSGDRNRIALGTESSKDQHLLSQIGGELKHAAIGAEQPASVPVGFALSFDGIDDYLETPIEISRSQPFTIEGWFLPADPFGSGAIVSNALDTGILMRQWFDERTATSQWSGMVRRQTINRVDVRHACRMGQSITHVAMVWDQAKVRLFVNGCCLSTASQPLESLPGAHGPLLIGTKYLRGSAPGLSDHWFHGEIDEVRISCDVRYDSDFTPDRRLPTEDSTLALYHFDSGTGEVAVDSSGRGNDAKIVGATWALESQMLKPSRLAEKISTFIAEIGRPLPQRSGPALKLEQPESIITLPPLAFDSSQPFTAELWVTPSSSFRSDDWKRILMQAGKLSLGLQKYHDVYAFQTWFQRSGISVGSASPESARYDCRNHLAGQWNGETLELFLNGRRCPAPMRYRNLSLEDVDGNLAAAVISAGQERITLGGRPNGKSVWGGLMDRFRLSRGIRYSHDFEPDNFQTDSRTIVLYDFHEGQGQVLHDVSGNGHHAEIAHASWDSPP